MKKPPRPVERHHVLIYSDDWRFLIGLYGPGSVKGVTVSEVIREIVHKGCKVLRQKIEDRAEAQAVAAKRNGGTRDV